VATVLFNPDMTDSGQILVPENVMAFHLEYWSNPVRDGSRRYNERNRTNRLSAARRIKANTRDQPKPEKPPTFDPQVWIVPEVGVNRGGDST
jgi:hypothetical protein